MVLIASVLNMKPWERHKLLKAAILCANILKSLIEKVKSGILVIKRIFGPVKVDVLVGEFVLLISLLQCFCKKCPVAAEKMSNADF